MSRHTCPFSLIPLWLAVILLACTAVPALAQSATGSIEGTIVDQSSAVMPGVTVTVRARRDRRRRAAPSPTRTACSACRCCRSASTTLTAELAGFAARKQPEITLTSGRRDAPDGDGGRRAWPRP